MKGGFGLFERFGVELEYMMVDAQSLRIRPEADVLIEAFAGSLEGDVARGRLAWSNELCLHVVELKTERPAARLAGLAEAMQAEVRVINRFLRPRGACLLPTAMHPWMNPRRESRLWPHGCREIYAAFDRIFHCAGHGWTNLQSTHLNLPFRTASEFRRLHSAIRLLLPLMPALAASSPFLDGKTGGALDMRLQVYRTNCRRIPSITGQVVPEPIVSPAEYRREILGTIYRDLAPHDPEKVLQEEWANARGAIARFERNTIEIRVLDIQECPKADLALVSFLVETIRALVDERFSSEKTQRAVATEELARLFLRVVRAGSRACVGHEPLLRALGWEGGKRPSVGDLWWHLLESVGRKRAPWRPVVEVILEQGNLSERLLRVTGRRPKRAQLLELYRRLAACLEGGEMFVP